MNLTVLIVKRDVQKSDISYSAGFLYNPGRATSNGRRMPTKCYSRINSMGIHRFNSRTFVRCVACFMLVALAATLLASAGCAGWSKHEKDGPQTVEDVLAAKRPG